MFEELKIAIIQHRPAVLDLRTGIERVAQYAAEAASNDARLVVFGETWLGGYPAWLDHCPEIALWDHEPARAVYKRMYLNSLLVSGSEGEQLQAIARQHQIWMGIGVNERVETGPGNGTIYNTFLLFDPEGTLRIHHRKLMPTYTEKLLYGTGDGAGLHSCLSAYGRIGGLICWEHWMPLTRQALHDSGEHIHLALWPNVHEMHQIASRHYAFEGRCFVIAIGQMLQADDFPEEVKLSESLQSDPKQWVLHGGSCITGPDGQWILEPVIDREGIIYAQISASEAIGGQMTLDPSGHYNRRDVFDFAVNQKRL